MKPLKVLLALITRENEYQREQATAAEATAQRLGVGLQVVYADNDAIAQTKQILSAANASAPDRPDAVIVEPVGTGMAAVAGACVGKGVGWIVLNREADYLVPLRQKSSVPIGSIECDNAEVGRIQGRQFAALLPLGGPMLYIQGPDTDVSRQRRAGLNETLPAGIAVQSIRGKWTEESAVRVVTPLLQGSRPPDFRLIGCQNDAMAMGARKAVGALTTEGHREQWSKVPFTGVDGVPGSGQMWVQKGLLAATVVIPTLTGVALEQLAEALASGTQMPERTLMPVTSYPQVDALRPAVST
jgi:ribose transport system substrate-binding protein